MRRVKLLARLLLVVSLVLPLSIAWAPASALAQGPDLAGPRTSSPEVAALKASQLVDWQTAAEQAAFDKIDPALQDAARNGGKDTVAVSITYLPGANVVQYLDRTIERPAVLENLQRAYGIIKTADLLKVASDPSVVAVVDATVSLRPKDQGVDRAPAPTAEENAARLAQLRANEVPWSETAAAQQVSGQGWFDVKSGHKSSAAWDKGFEGQGVIVGVLDDGVDFAHPDLQGTYAVNMDESSPYYGWPMAFSQLSMTYWAEEVMYADLGAHGITGAWAGSMWADTQTTQTEDTDGNVWYQPVGSTLAYAYEPTGTSASGTYKLGSLNEHHLIGSYGQRVAILVVDEDVADVYDTVYIDLDNDHSFADEKPVTKESPTAYRDMDSDGYADISGGLLVWLSDGVNMPPMVDWLWGIQPGDEVGTLKALPGSGDLLIFTGPFDDDYSHGTQCASAVAAQGVLSDGLTAQPFAEGGMVQGAAPKVGIMDFSNHYYSGTDEDEYLVVALGYDGIPDSGDEVQIASNSYGAFRQMWGAWGYFGRLITAINLDLAPTSVWLFSAGNEGPGYGPQEGDGGPTTIQVGTSTQYGSTNWDSISSIDQIVYGDASNWYSHGPNNDGSVGVDVLTNGGRGSGDEALNYYGYYGAESWATWGGTSRSAPAAAGNLALIYQAYKARHGEWPTWDVAKALFKSTANDASSSPFLQGGGVVNADRGTDVAAGLYGVYTMPDEWRVGGWEGDQYLNFASVAQPGDVWNQEFTVTNPGGYPIKVGLDDAVMVKYDEMELEFTTSYQGWESEFNFHSPDYLVPLNPADIPADAELMVVRYIHPYSSYDPNYDFSSADSSWRFLVYNWTDQNHDGKLWVDANGNGVVNHQGNGQYDNDGFERIDFAHSEIQEGEYIRMDYSFGGIGLPNFIRDPLARMADGYYFGFQHRNNNGAVDQTTFKIGVEFYKRADWGWLSLSTDKLLVPAEGEATFDAQMAIPANAAPGTYEGIILVNDPGNFMYDGHETALPIIVNVMADLPDDGALSLGFGARDDLLYQNGWYNGYFNWYGGGWTGAGDWRRWFINVDEADLENNRLLFHTSWSGGYPTDWNTWVLGPTNDYASNGDGPSPWYDFALGQPNQDVYGPYTLAPIAASEPFRAGATYPFSTSSGGPDDWVVAMPTQAGLYEVAIHNVLADGEQLWEQVGVDVGTIDLEAYMDPDEGVVTVGSIDAQAYDSAGQIELNIIPTLAIPDMIVSLAGGLATDTFGPYPAFVVDNGGGYDAFLPTNTVKPFTVDQQGATELVLHLEMQPGQDADMFLVRDNNHDGIATAGVDSLVGSSGNSTGTDEEIVVANPALGDYLAVFCGYNVDPDSGVSLDWWYRVVYPGGLPYDEVDAYNGPAQTVRRVWDDPTTAEFKTTIAADERAGALHVAVTGIPRPEIADVWVLDAHGNKLADSVKLGQADEELVIYPPAGQYRFETGETFTIVIYDKKIEVDPPLVHLRAWWDHLNLWLSTDDPEVTAMSIDAGQAARVYVNYDKPGWAVGDADLSARVIAGPSVLPMAFDELLTIERVDEPSVPVWNPDNLLYSVTPDSDRGFLPNDARWWFGGTDPIATALIGPNEWVTYTVRVENTDVVESDDLAVDVFPAMEDYFSAWDVIPATYQVGGATPRQVDGVDYEWLSGPADDIGDELLWMGVLGPGEVLEFSYRVQMPADMAPNKNHTTGIDIYIGAAFDWFDWATAGAWNRPAQFAADKSADAYYVYGGDQITYTVEAQAIAGQDQEVWIVDTLPAEVEFVSATNGATYDDGDHTVSWTGMLPGSATDTVSIDIVVNVAVGLPFESTFENVAALYLDPEDDPIDTMSWECVVDSAAWLDIDKTADKRWAQPGQDVGFTITMANLGTDPALGVVMSDVVPEGFALDGGSVMASKASSGALVDGDEIVWEGDIEVGEVVTITFTATVAPDIKPGMVLVNGVEAVADNFPWRVYDGMPLQVIRNLPKWMPTLMSRFWQAAHD